MAKNLTISVIYYKQTEELTKFSKLIYSSGAQSLCPMGQLSGMRSVHRLNVAQVRCMGMMQHTSPGLCARSSHRLIICTGAILYTGPHQNNPLGCPEVWTPGRRGKVAALIAVDLETTHNYNSIIIRLREKYTLQVSIC